MVRALPYLVPIALLLYALIDLSRSEPAERADVPLVAWVLIVVVLPVVGPIAWIVVSRTRRAEQGGRASGPVAPPTRPAPRRSPGPVAPDDDPEFLWRLEQERRRRRGRGTPPGGATSAPGTPGTAPGTTPGAPAGTGDDAPGEAP